ncbi:MULTISPECIES: AraC family transcriptional regulator [unclassified Trinickia]|jgi:transcriptional regulator GlxA family with amidase domain|uniref:AraC family transcriptional regulator n=1 Tax=unclassified Trinickia TaxID=2638168 RepID=UPI00240670E7|nr:MULTISPECIES: AraC family transcriptional regulator [unclassified Trinickia]MDG0025007.1 AraC family transcriptional regulator [Trinickia sp. Y13]HVW53463.1 AraC family transcriptional regulator [Trinickia sp.]
MRIAMLLYAGFQLLEVSGPMDVFHAANRLYGRAFYEPHVVGTSPGPVLSSNGTAVGTTECLFETRARFDVVVVPGSPVVSSVREHRELVTWLGDAGPRTQRLACISNGAFLLARAGVADRRWLTTHWRDAHRLAAEYPRVHVMSSPGCLKDGNLYSSGGASAGIHLALSIVREDLGASTAEAIARRLLMQPH